MIGERFVPLVLNGDAGNQPGMVSAFFGRVAKHFANEMAVVTPNGRLLSHDLAEGLKKWNLLPIEERLSLEDLGKFDSSFLPSPPPGGLVLDVFARALLRDGKGQLRIYKTEVARSREAGRDHLWLTATEAAALLPTSTEPGARQAVEASVVDRFCRRYLVDLVRVGGNGGPRSPDEVLAQDIEVIVVAATDRDVRVKLAGSARLATRDAGSGAQKNSPKVDDYHLQGEATWDRVGGRFSKFILVAFSETGHYDEIHKKTIALGVVFSLSPADSPADLAPPSSYGKDYFSERPGAAR